MSKVAYIFPGQGSQFVGMGLDLYKKYPFAKAVFDEADRVLGFSLSKLCFEGPEDELTLTKNAQPALLTMSIACLAAARGSLPAADFMAGHSLGEYSALTAAEALYFDTAVSLARERGRLMYEAGLEKPGAMAAVIGMSHDLLAEICQQTGAFIANLNCSGQIVISGAKDAVSEASKLAKLNGAKLAIPLQVSGAFHSPLMQSAADGLRQSVQKIPLLGAMSRAAESIRNSSAKFSAQFTASVGSEPNDSHIEGIKSAIESTYISVPLIPVVGNTQAQILDSAEAVRDELLEQVCSCVQWEKTVEYLRNQGVDTFIEIGPGEVLTGLVKRIYPEAITMNIGDVESIEKLAGKEL